MVCCDLEGGVGTGKEVGTLGSFRRSFRDDVTVGTRLGTGVRFELVVEVGVGFGLVVGVGEKPATIFSGVGVSGVGEVDDPLNGLMSKKTATPIVADTTAATVPITAVSNNVVLWTSTLRKPI